MCARVGGDGELVQDEVLVQWREHFGCALSQRDATSIVNVTRAERVEENQQLDPGGDRWSSLVPELVADRDELGGEHGDAAGLAEEEGLELKEKTRAP